MVELIDSKELQNVEDIQQKYRNCKFVISDFVREKGTVTKGYLYAVSTSSDSYETLFDYMDQLEDDGIECMIDGSYNNGGGVGMQYVVRK